jgi:hypothetical protein
MSALFMLGRSHQRHRHGKFRIRDHRAPDRVLTPGQGLLLCVIIVLGLYFAVWAAWKVTFGG